jgi:hypothetical protein
MENRPMDAPRDPIMQFFRFDHLKPELQAVSRPWCELAEKTHAELPRNAERSTALRKLLEGKDAAVRALLFVASLFVLLVAWPALAQDGLHLADTGPAPALVHVEPAAQPLSMQVFVWLVNGGAAALAGLLLLGVRLLAQKYKGNRFAELGVKVAGLAAAVASHAEAELRPMVDKDLTDGKLQPDEAAALKLAAMNELRVAGAPVIAEVRKAFGFDDKGLTTFLSGVLEQQVARLPPAPPATTPASPPAPSKSAAAAAEVAAKLAAVPEVKS